MTSFSWSSLLPMAALESNTIFCSSALLWDGNNTKKKKNEMTLQFQEGFNSTESRRQLMVQKQDYMVQQIPLNWRSCVEQGHLFSSHQKLKKLNMETQICFFQPRNTFWVCWVSTTCAYFTDSCLVLSTYTWQHWLLIFFLHYYFFNQITCLPWKCPCKSRLLANFQEKMQQASSGVQ